MNNGAGFIGFKPEDLNLHYSLCGSKATEIIEKLCTVSTSILDEIAHHWASPEAVIFCQNWAEKFNGLIDGARAKVVEIMSAIKVSGDSWSSTSGYVLYLPSQEGYINAAVKHLQCNAKDNINGVVGVDYAMLDMDVKGHFRQCFPEDIDYAIQGFKLNAADLGFIGANQMASLKDSLDLIFTTFTEKREELENELGTSLNNVAEEYRKTGNTISSQFNSLG